MNLFNCRVPVIATIFRNVHVTPQYTTIIFSHPTQGIYFLIHLHNYAKIKGHDLGKIMSLPKTCSTYMHHLSHHRK